ncbi:MAG TPA: dTMP kinase [Solirubrobacterales bacterium]|nr:dTMP kinase [Solirubrobacterales bacterium]
MFITLEGIDRSGKTTQAAMLAGALGPRTLLVREPGGTPAGERIRGLLKDSDLELGPGAELMLFCAARSELASRVIAPACDERRDVVCDRYIDSTAAYQGAAIGELYAGGPGYEGRDAREIGFELIERLNAIVVGACVPDLTILVRVDPEAAAARGQQRLDAGSADGSDRFEARGIAFQREVADAYDELARRNPERIVVVDGAGSPAEVHERVIAAVAERR